MVDNNETLFQMQHKALVSCTNLKGRTKKILWVKIIETEWVKSSFESEAELDITGQRGSDSMNCKDVANCWYSPSLEPFAIYCSTILLVLFKLSQVIFITPDNQGDL